VDGDVPAGQLHRGGVQGLDVRGGDPAQHLVQAGALRRRRPTDGDGGPFHRDPVGAGRGDSAPWPAVPELLAARQREGSEHASGEDRTAARKADRGRQQRLLSGCRRGRRSR